MSVFSPRRGQPTVDRAQELARRLEEHVHFTSLEARAYVDHRLDAIEGRNVVSREDLERSTRLAVEEAKAYADEAATSLARSLRGVASVALQASRTPTAPEAALPRRLVELSGAMREAADKGALRTDARGSVERLGRAVEDLAAGLEAVVATTQDIERILASLVQDLGDRPARPPGGAEP